MTYYDQHIRPRLHAHPEWQRVQREIEAAEVRLQQLRTDKINLETRLVCEWTYPQAGD